MSFRFFFTFLLCALFHIGNASAIDCPSISFKNYQTSMTGMEITSNTSPEQKAVRLTWRNPTDKKPLNITILRKKIGEGFQPIGTVTGSTETYLDKTIAPGVSTYFYVLKNTYTCSSINFSDYLEVPLLLERDSTAPVMRMISPQMRSKEDPILFWLHDPETGIAQNSMKVSIGEKALTGGKFYGSMHDKIWYFLPTSTTFSKEKDLISSEIKNTVQYPTLREQEVSASPQTNTVRFSNTSAGTLFIPEKALTLTWKTKTPITTEHFTLSVSGDNGTTWSSITTSADTTFTFDGSSTTLTEVLNQQGTTLLFRIELFQQNKTLISYDYLPFLKGSRQISISSPINTVFLPTGAIKIFDAYTGSQVNWKLHSGTIADLQKNWQFTNTIQTIQTPIAPGYYFLKFISDTHVFPSIYPANTQEGIYYFDGSATLLPLSAEPRVYYESLREEISQDHALVLSGTKEPIETSPYSFPTAPIEDKEATLPISIPSQKVPFAPVVTYCTSSILCIKDTLTPKNEHEELTLFYDPLHKNFYTPGATVKSETSTSFPNASTLFYTISYGTGTQIRVPSIVFQQQKQAMELMTIAEDTVSISSILEKAAQQSSSFITYHIQNACNQQLQDGSIPYFSLCNAKNELSTILRTKKIHPHLAAAPFSYTIELNQWYTPFVALFAYYNAFFDTTTHITAPHEELTRGEVAYLIAQATHTEPFVGEHPFADITSITTHSGALLSLYREGVLEGEEKDGKRLISPERKVLRSEAIKMLMAGMRLHTDKLTIAPFADSNVSDWFYPYLNRAYTFGLIEGYKEGSAQVFKPFSYVTRAEMLKLITVGLQRKIQ